MTKKLIAGIAVLLIVAFVGSTFVINSLNKSRYEEIARQDINDLKASIASMLTPLAESPATAEMLPLLLQSIQDLNISLEASPYKSGLFHSRGTLTIKTPHDTLYIDAVFSNILFGTSRFTLTSPDSEIRELFQDGEIGVLELRGKSLSIHLSDLLLKDPRSTLEIKGASLVLHITRDYALTDIAFRLPEFSYTNRAGQTSIRNLTTKGVYDTPLTYQDFLTYITQGGTIAITGKSTINMESFSIKNRYISTEFKNLTIRGSEKTQDDPKLLHFLVDFAFKDLVIANTSDDFTLAISDFASTLEIQNFSKNAMEFLNYIDNPFLFYLKYGEQSEQMIQEILEANPKLIISDSSFALNGKQLTYSGDGQITPELTEFRFAISSKFSVQELLESYKGVSGFDEIISELEQYFIKPADSKLYSTTIHYREEQDTTTLTINDQVMLERTLGEDIYIEEMSDESDLLDKLEMPSK